ncbi:PaaI family thioesterase [Asticcacaulis sp. ZE23SCel15]|uniref:PaaI family thioesterase n=1 Tax=Asticcacaulis sp. ZE23SCel15 TaxID=3059027 RepID=UPI00265E1A0E|nr:PaaI family thioesterase [Asticcacaulis sp. ZE23SCel15]WKL56522.1 PaaI family thioesterase [Asticcacaulis sp. ZE23SCel15]
MSHRDLPENILEQIPFARFLGVKMELAGNELTLKLPYEDRLIGNPVLPALHGGVIGAFMEMTAMAQLAFSENFTHMPKPINVSVQYLRSGKATDTFARARLNRVGRTIANVDVIAWQDNKEMPIATLQSHFLLKG